MGPPDCQLLKDDPFRGIEVFTDSFEGPLFIGGVDGIKDVGRGAVQSTELCQSEPGFGRDARIDPAQPQTFNSVNDRLVQLEIVLSRFPSTRRAPQGTPTVAGTASRPTYTAGARRSSKRRPVLPHREQVGYVFRSQKGHVRAPVRFPCGVREFGS